MSDRVRMILLPNAQFPRSRSLPAPHLRSSARPVIVACPNDARPAIIAATIEVSYLAGFTAPEATRAESMSTHLDQLRNPGLLDQFHNRHQPGRRQIRLVEDRLLRGAERRHDPIHRIQA